MEGEIRPSEVACGMFKSTKTAMRKDPLANGSILQGKKIELEPGSIFGEQDFGHSNLTLRQFFLQQLKFNVVPCYVIL